MSNGDWKSAGTDSSGQVLSTIVEIGTDLASLPASADLFEYLARTLQRVTGATVVTVGEYVPERQELVMRRVEAQASSLES